MWCGGRVPQGQLYLFHLTLFWDTTMFILLFRVSDIQSHELQAVTRNNSCFVIWEDGT